MNCRHCGGELRLPFVDLVSAPPSNAYLSADAIGRPEKWFPLRVLVCEGCWLVQTEFSPTSELFDAEYAYFSGFSTTWLAHCERYVAQMTEALGLGESSHVVEVAANDGYLLQYFKARHIPSTGVEPTASTAAAARAKGLDIVEEFFGARLAESLVARGRAADLTIANNVLAHVPDINDFVHGFALLLKPEGVATFEFPHLLTLVAEKQFDTIYHEHYSYLSLTAVTAIFAKSGLSVFDVERLPTHGGSLRVHAQRHDTGKRPVSERVRACLDEETSAGVKTAAYYASFQAATDGVKNGFLRFLVDAQAAGKVVAGYGAAAKANTLMNYAGIKPDLVRFVVDRNPAKQGRFMPGSHVPIVDEAHLKKARPDYVVIFPWNLRDEITKQLDYVREWKGLFVAAPDWRAS